MARRRLNWSKSKGFSLFMLKAVSTDAERNCSIWPSPNPLAVSGPAPQNEHLFCTFHGVDFFHQNQTVRGFRYGRCVGSLSAVLLLSNTRVDLPRV